MISSSLLLFSAMTAYLIGYLYYTSRKRDEELLEDIKFLQDLQQKSNNTQQVLLNKAFYKKYMLNFANAPNVSLKAFDRSDLSDLIDYSMNLSEEIINKIKNILLYVGDDILLFRNICFIDVNLNVLLNITIENIADSEICYCIKID